MRDDGIARACSRGWTEGVGTSHPTRQGTPALGCPPAKTHVTAPRDDYARALDCHEISRPGTSEPSLRASPPPAPSPARAGPAAVRPGKAVRDYSEVPSPGFQSG